MERVQSTVQCIHFQWRQPRREPAAIQGAYVLWLYRKRPGDDAGRNLCRHCHHDVNRGKYQRCRDRKHHRRTVHVSRFHYRHGSVHYFHRPRDDHVQLHRAGQRSDRKYFIRHDLHIRIALFYVAGPYQRRRQRPELYSRAQYQRVWRQQSAKQQRDWRGADIFRQRQHGVGTGRHVRDGQLQRHQPYATYIDR